MLESAGAELVQFEPNFMTRFLGVITNPNVAYILMLIGIYGLIFEFANPGIVFSGVIGAISLILGLFALNLLPVNYAAFALVGLGVALMIAEVFSPSFGIMGIGGAIAFALGSMMIFDGDVPGFELDISVVIAADRRNRADHLHCADHGLALVFAHAPSAVTRACRTRPARC